MKLLYVWIDQFRSITQQGIVIDDEYSISVELPDTENILYLDNENYRVHFSGKPSRLYRKVYRRKINIKKNEQYKGVIKDSPIESITALVGENASDKSNIIECLHMRADQFHYGNEEQRYYFLVFLDEANSSIIVRTRDIWLIDEETRKRDLRSDKGYEEYIIPLSSDTDQPSIKSGNTTDLVSVYQHRRQETEGAYSVMGLPTIPINLDRSNPRNAFVGMFDFFCDFPKLGGEDNNLVIFLHDENSREKPDYFTKKKMTSEEYKSYFIYKLANLLFGKLRDFLYHEKPRFTASEKRVRRPEEDTLIKEDMECAKVLSFCCFDFPKNDSTSLVAMQREDFPKERILHAISFFRKSTYVYNGKSRYDSYIDSLEKLFNCLYDVSPKFFTAFYKLEIPFKNEFKNIVVAFWNCLKQDYGDKNWCESVAVGFEWFSAGEYQLATMFSGLYQWINNRHEETKNRDLILLFDEPEMHMHPETGRRFIDNLERILRNFKESDLINHCQIILATHSPFIIHYLGKYNNSIALVKEEKGRIKVCDFNDDLNKLKLPNRESYSFNIVMYRVFDVPTIELHNELYGVLQEENKKYKIRAIEAWFTQSKLHIQKTKLWIEEKDGKAQLAKVVTLQTYIRNSIHHPENQQNAEYSKDELQKSIDQMFELLPQKNFD